MMKRLLKWLGVILGVLLALIVVAVIIGVYVVSNSRLNQQYDVTVEMIPIPDNAEAVARGEHIAQSRGCMDCHEDDLSGGVLLDDALSDGDMADLIAYLKTLPAVDNQPGENRAGPLARVLFLTGGLPLLPVELIDHDSFTTGHFCQAT